ncbi:MAG: sulfatase-like hydrolase/transferase, partial [Actinomycetota bacterium]|nr:sulfatase-like hydrolase/transferase [Actinomycetota bacterium]
MQETAAVPAEGDAAVSEHASSLPRLVARRTAIIAGLSALAVTQPLLGLFGDNATFFVAGRYTPAQIVAFAMVVAFVPTLIGGVLVAISAAANRRAGTIVFVTLAAMLATAFALTLLRSAAIDSTWLVLPLAAAFAGIVAVGIVRSRAARLFTSYLAVADVAFVALFLFASGTTPLVIGDGGALSTDGITMPAPEGPIVVVVFDELPVVSLLRGDGTINATRYPGFADLAGTSTWFRNAASNQHETQRAVPALLTGNNVAEGVLPTYADHPRNLFTLLGATLPVRRYEAVTSMCPPDTCEPLPPRPLRQALDDAAVVYGHRVLPAGLRDGLPPIDGSWGEFGADGGTVPKLKGSELMKDAFVRSFYENTPQAQRMLMRREIEAIDRTPGVHYVHVLLPHYPWTLDRAGHDSPPIISWYSFVQSDPDRAGFDFRSRVLYQMHLRQLTAVDELVERLLARLRALPNWDQTTLVVTSDHGLNLMPPDIGRDPITERNKEAALRVPLFIKAPGQTTGEVRDEAADTIDVLPSLVDLLDVSLASADEEWTFDGHSLYDGSEPTSPRVVTSDVAGLDALAQRQAARFPRGDDWRGLAAVGRHGTLVGEQVAGLRVGAPSELI